MTSKRPMILTVSYLLAVMLVMSACGGLTRSDKPAARVWWLQPVTAVPQAAPAGTPVPLVLTVSVVPGLDNDRILTLSDDAELKPYAGARWAENLPELVSSLIARSLQASGRFEVLQQRSGRAEDVCDLRIEVREFFADLDAAGTTAGVSVEVSGRYQCAADAARSLNSRSYVGVGAGQLNIIVASFQQALDQVTMDLINKM